MTRASTEARLAQVMAAARAAAEARLGAVLGRIEAARTEAARLRAEIGRTPGDPVDAAGLAAAARWRQSLAERARAEDARALELAGKLPALRKVLAEAFGREAAAQRLAAQARARACAEAARRADLAMAAGRPAQPVPSSSDPSLAPCSALPDTGSPGIA